MAEEEVIFVQTDPAFNIVLGCLRQLRNQKRLQVTHAKIAKIQDIESANPDYNKRLVFGGRRPGRSVQAFSRTASSVARMCMLEAASIRPDLWPKLSPVANFRNKHKIESQVLLNSDFRLAEDEPRAKLFWSKYDQLYPHFLIEEKLDQAVIDGKVTIPSMMIIFKRNFTECYEITTTFDATKRKKQRFDATKRKKQRFNSYVHVLFIVRSIAQEDEEKANTGKDDDDDKFIRLVKDMLRPISVEDSYYDQMMKIKSPEDLKNLPVAFEHVTYADEEEEEEKEETDGETEETSTEDSEDE